ncbi:MAG: carbohydrate-binding protein [Paludibacteraceae bacterium]|nr:carbohydrate-binding protein [Paludibacteraceae bacterium]
MKKFILSFVFQILLFSPLLLGQNSISVGSGSFAEYPPVSVWDEDGYFAKTYRWFHDNWSNLYIHENARHKPLPTNKWWTNYVFSQYGGDAWAYPHAVSADNEGINIKIPSGFQGGGMITTPFLEIKGASHLAANEEKIVFADFESTTYPEGWSVGANPPYQGPVSLSDISQSPAPSGFTGNRFIDSYKGNEAKLTLISSSFVISKKYIQLRVGGGNYINDTYVGLFVNGVRVFVETGQNSGTLTQRTWDVSSYLGQTAEIRILDNSTGGWGFIMCDEIVFSDSNFSGSGYQNDFSPQNSNVYDWTDLGFTFRSEDQNGRYMDVTLVHGIPFTWIELNNLVPLLIPGATCKIYDLSGNEIINFPVSLNAFTMEFGNRIYGIHLPTGSILYRSTGGDFQVEIPTSSPKYLVVSDLPNRNLLSLYDAYARNKPVNTSFLWDYKISEGKINTTFQIDTKNLQTGALNGETLMSFLPHHYRNTTINFNYINGADYQLILGKMHTASGQLFSIDYSFGGMPPYLPEPLNLTDVQKQRLNDMINYKASHSGGFNGNTYAKGLGENSNVMLMAKTMNANSAFTTLKNNLKTEFTDWWTYDPSEASNKKYFFANYPDYGAMIGFPPGYGSQGFNDLHFHYGYFTVGAARLMMVDNDFKQSYADMAKLIVKSFANWKHYPDGNDYLPFLRTFDPYFGHSFAGGTGDGGGNNQESTSEAIHSWFGIYLLGVELNDPEITALGATGFLLESTAAKEYWLDVHSENIPSTYRKNYVGILRTDNLAWATYFSGDPAWILGIQAVPCDFFYNYLSQDSAKIHSIWQSMLIDRTTQMIDPDGDGPLGAQPLSSTTDPFQNIFEMGSYLGGYQLNLMNTFNPVKAAQFTDSLYSKGGSWATDVNMITDYYIANATITYGIPAEGFHTSIPSGAVYKNQKGELTYLLYNPTNKDVDVAIYKDNAIIDNIKVAAHTYYNSRMMGGQKPVVAFIKPSTNEKFALNDKIKLTVSANDNDGKVQWVDFYEGKTKIGSIVQEPYTISYAPTSAGMKEFYAVAVDDMGNRSDSCKMDIEVLSIQQMPYNTTSWNIPADKILAVQFDKGGAEVACHDNEITVQGGNNLRGDTGVETENSNGNDGNIGYTNAGEWYEYTINVQTAGIYTLSVRLSSAYGGALRFEFDGEDKTGSININKTGGWGNYKDTIVTQIPLKAGIQVMRVVIDKAGANLSSYKFSLINANMPPAAYAGNDIIIDYPQNSAQLSGLGEAYGGATISSYEWKQIDSNPIINISNPFSATTTVSGLNTRTYVFELKVTDSNGLSGTDQVAVLVKPENFAPVSKPGNNFTIKSDQQPIKLDGSNSVDPDGKIVKFLWEQMDSNNRLIIEQASLENPVAFVSGFQANKLYVIQLTVTDDLGATSAANISILVEAGSTEVNEHENQFVIVSPNPFKDQLKIFLGRDMAFNRLLLRTISGSLIMDKNIQNCNEFNLNTSYLKPGYYILTLISDRQVITYKIVK